MIRRRLSTMDELDEAKEKEKAETEAAKRETAAQTKANVQTLSDLDPALFDFPLEDQEL